ncbi:PqqD family protein [Virgibacillus flavescens]|uniref:PqqD family protein n=1 Tax=Virgibacillus flavescens TaxID=1611422 RepID=UPI003D342CEE
MKYIRKQDFETTILEDEWIVLDSNSYTITTLNEVGGYCWDLLHEQQTVEDIVQSLQERYILTEKTIEEDIVVFLTDLIKYGLVEYAN